jgi:hypothetical protein
VNTDGIKQRVQRLDELSRGLAKEIVLTRAANDPLLYLERRAYLNGIQDALAGVEGARVALARARQRLERDTETPPVGSVACSPCSSPAARVRSRSQTRSSSARVACNSASRRRASSVACSARARRSSNHGNRESGSGEFDTATVLSRAGERESCHLCKGRAAVVVWRVVAVGV